MSKFKTSTFATLAALGFMAISPAIAMAEPHPAPPADSSYRTIQHDIGDGTAKEIVLVRDDNADKFEAQEIRANNTSFSAIIPDFATAENLRAKAGSKGITVTLTSAYQSFAWDHGYEPVADDIKYGVAQKIELSGHDNFEVREVRKDGVEIRVHVPSYSISRDLAKSAKKNGVEISQDDNYADRVHYENGVDTFWSVVMVFIFVICFIGILF